MLQAGTTLLVKLIGMMTLLTCSALNHKVKFLRLGLGGSFDTFSSLAKFLIETGM